jgi:hypothetical protein
MTLSEGFTAGLMTGLVRLRVRLRVEYHSAAAAPAGEPHVTQADYRYVPGVADFIVENPIAT